MIENVADVAAVAEVGAYGPDANNVISRGDLAACISAQCDVVTASRIGAERLKTLGCVAVSSCIVTKRPIPVRRVPGPV